MLPAAYSNYIDRTNLAFASVQLNADIGLSPSIYGLGSGLFFISYACEYIPLAAGATGLGMLPARYSIIVWACTRFASL